MLHGGAVLMDTGLQNIIVTFVIYNMEKVKPDERQHVSPGNL